MTVLNGSGIKQGPAIILKVMSGDTVDLSVRYFYNNMGGTTQAPLSPDDLLGGLAGGLFSITGGTHGAIADLINGTTSPLVGALNSWVNDPAIPAAADKPKAYLNWILLDNQFRYVGGMVGINSQSGALQVGDAGTVNGQLQAPLAVKGLPISKSGYLYIYLSNVTEHQDVFFDNLSIVHYSGPMVEENHYYPFGLTMAGISDKALKSNYAENKYRYNKGTELQNKEFADGSGLELYETPLRSLDPQLGRWWQVDSKPTEAESPYSAMGNNPILHNDPLGDSVPQWIANLHFRPAEPRQYDLHPVTAALADFSYTLAGFFGLTSAENAVRTVANPNASSADKAFAVVSAGFAMTRGKEGPVGEGEGGGAEGDKAVPNPYGKTGSPEHVDVVDHAAAQLKKDGYTVRKEVEVPTPGGNKEKRYVDVVGTKDGSPTRYIQVGAQNKNGSPVSREAKALDDLNRVIFDGSIEFWPYKTRN